MYVCLQQDFEKSNIRGITNAINLSMNGGNMALGDLMDTSSRAWAVLNFSHHTYVSPPHRCHCFSQVGVFCLKIILGI